MASKGVQITRQVIFFDYGNYFIQMKTAKNVCLDTLNTRLHFNFNGESSLSIRILNFHTAKDLQKLTFIYISFVGYSLNFGIFNSYFFR